MSGTPRSTRSVPGLVAGGVLVLLGSVWLLATLDVRVPVRSLLAVGLAVTGGALVVGAFQGQRYTGLTALGIVLTLLLAVGSTASNAFDVPFAVGMGERTVTPTGPVSLAEDHRLFAGQLTLDLRSVDVPQGVTQIEASVMLGQLVVRVPADAAVEVDAAVGVGQADVLRTSQSGPGVDLTVRTPGYEQAGDRLRLELRVGLGQIEVR